MAAQRKTIVSRLLKQSIVELCKVSVPYDQGLEIDGIVCITVGNEVEQIVVKVHEMLDSGTEVQAATSTGSDRGSIDDQCAGQISGRRESEIDPGSPEDLLHVPTDSNACRPDEEPEGSDNLRYEEKRKIAEEILIRHKKNIENNNNIRERHSEQPIKVEVDSPSKENLVRMPINAPQHEPGIKVEHNGSPGIHVAPVMFREAVCEHCKVLLPSHGALKEHNERVHSAYTCELCWRSFLFHTNYILHMRAHHNYPSTYPEIQVRRPSPIRPSRMGFRGCKCGICGQLCGPKSNMLYHLKTCHEFEVTNSCKACNEYFPNRSSYLIHAQLCHNERRGIAEAGQVLNRQRLSPNRRQEVDEVPNPPAQPSPSLSMHSDASLHAATSTVTHCISRENSVPSENASPEASNLPNESREPSEDGEEGDETPAGPMMSDAAASYDGDDDDSSFYIKQVFSLKCNLMVKQRIQNCSTPLKGPFRCMTCDMLCAEFAEYEAHMQEQHWRFVCPYCAQTFATRRNVKRHIRKHTGEHPYVCKECGQTFYRDDDLKRHGEKHRQGRVYQCSCGFSTGDKSSFLQHLATQHQMEVAKLTEEDLDKFVCVPVTAIPQQFDEPSQKYEDEVPKYDRTLQKYGSASELYGDAPNKYEVVPDKCEENNAAVDDSHAASVL